MGPLLRDLGKDFIMDGNEQTTPEEWGSLIPVAFKRRAPKSSLEHVGRETLEVAVCCVTEAKPATNAPRDELNDLALAIGYLTYMTEIAPHFRVGLEPGALV